MILVAARNGDPPAETHHASFQASREALLGGASRTMADANNVKDGTANGEGAAQRPKGVICVLTCCVLFMSVYTSV